MRAFIIVSALLSLVTLATVSADQTTSNTKLIFVVSRHMALRNNGECVSDKHYDMNDNFYASSNMRCYCIAFVHFKLIGI